MNPLDPVKWGAQAAFSIGSTAFKLGINAVRTAELLLGRNDGDDADHRYRTVATTVERDRETPGSAARPRTPDPAPARTPGVPRGARRQNDVQPPTGGHVDEEPDLVESEGAAAPSATLRVDAPFEGYDKLRAPEIVARVRESDAATKAVVRLYEQTHKKRKSVLAATE